MHVSNIDHLSQNETAVLFVFHTQLPSTYTHRLTGEWKVDDLRWTVNTRTHMKISSGDVCALCTGLVNRGYLTCTSNCATVASRRFKLTATFGFFAIRTLMNAATEHGWWPTSTSWSHENAHRVIRALFANGRGLAKAIADNENYEDETWADIDRFIELASTVKPFPLDTLCKPAPDVAYRIFGSAMFSRGLDFSPFLDAWASEIAGGRPFATTEAALEYISHCVWTGHLAKLDVITPAALANCRQKQLVDDYLVGCRALAAGDLDAAYKATAFLTSFRHDAHELQAVEAFGLFATHLLALMITLFHKPTKTRTAKLAKFICPAKADACSEEMTPAVRRRLIRLHDFHELAEPFWGEEGDEKTPPQDPICTLADVAIALQSGINRDIVESRASDALVAVENAVSNHQPTVAGMILSVFGWAFPAVSASRLDAVAKAATDAGCVWFRPFGAAEQTPWKAVLRELDKRLPVAKKQKAAAAPAKTGRIVWALRLSVLSSDNPYYRSDDEVGAVRQPPAGTLYVCHSVTPCYRGPRGADDGSADKPLTDNALQSGKYDACLTDADRRVLAASRRKTTYFRHGQFDADHLAALGEGALVTAACYDHKGSHGYSYLPITFVRRAIPIEAKSRPDGGMTLALPAWCGIDGGDGFMIVKESDDAFAVYPITPDVASVTEVFRLYGKENTIEVPKDGATELRPLMGRIAALFPIQGELKTIGDSADLPRIKGEARPVIRLDYDDDTLQITLRIRPVADQKELLFAPGAGQPERIVALGGRSTVLVRDLAAERTAAAAVTDALANANAWRNEPNVWSVSDLTDALEALAAVKSLGDAGTLEWRGDRRLSVYALPQDGIRWQAAEGADRWFEVRGDFTLDDGRILSIVRLLESLPERNGAFVPFGDRAYVKLTRELLRRLEALAAAGRRKKDAVSVPPAALPMLASAFDKGKDGKPLPGDLRTAAERYATELGRTVTVPSRLQAELRPYQEEGYVWLAHLTACGFGACLADDMGLGKTLQAIALLLARAADGPSLVVVPASVCGNWRREIIRFAPTLRPVMGWDFASATALGPQDVVVVSYGLLVSREDDFAARDWNGVVLDEAQSIKNETTKRAKAVKRLRSSFRLAATGTPVENRLTELWSIFDFLNPGLLGPLDSFAQRLTRDGRATEALKGLVRPFVLRRLKQDVLDDLPPKTEITLSVDLGDDERTAYEGCRRHALATLAEGGKDNRLSILAELMRLRRFCCHPSLVLPDFASSAKMDTLVDLLADLRAGNHRALVFSQFTDYLAIIRRELDAQGWTYQYLDGTTSAHDRDKAVDAFQRGDGDFFLLSLKAGGTGLNLTAANYVILLDPWWNPAVESQAADRAHRIGQRDPVTVYHLIAADTVEERIRELHGEKRALAEDVLDGTGAAPLTPEELMGLFR